MVEVSTSLEGCTALITGAAQGIGRVIAGSVTSGDQFVSASAALKAFGLDRLK